MCVFSLREISTLRELKHPNIVNLIDVIMDTQKIYLVFEFLYMDLKKYMDDQKSQGSRIDLTLSTSYMFQLSQVKKYFTAKIYGKKSKNFSQTYKN
jgi:serine/threonine protein kinase